MKKNDRALKLKKETLNVLLDREVQVLNVVGGIIETEWCHQTGGKRTW